MADWNVGDRMMLAEPSRTVWPLTFGSGKSGTPCERMHLENATPDSTASVADAAALPWPVALPELPPHPLASTPLRSATAVSGRARVGLNLLAWMLYGIGFSPVFISGCEVGRHTRRPPARIPGTAGRWCSGTRGSLLRYR